MPIYEFFCPECKVRFEELCSIGTKYSPCPKCGHVHTERQVSAFGIGGKGSSSVSNSSSSSCGSCHGGHCHSCH